MFVIVVFAVTFAPTLPIAKQAYVLGVYGVPRTASAPPPIYVLLPPPFDPGPPITTRPDESIRILSRAYVRVSVVSNVIRPGILLDAGVPSQNALIRAAAF